MMIKSFEAIVAYPGYLPFATAESKCQLIQITTLLIDLLPQNQPSGTVQHNILFGDSYQESEAGLSNNVITNCMALLLDCE
jgi:hypothetical protein